MAGGTFAVSVVTPERAVLETEARFAAIPAWDGELGVLAGRAPLVCKLGAGELRIEGPDGGTESLFVDGGFAEVVHGRLTILTETALPPAELGRDEAKRLLEEARAMPVGDDASFAARQHAVEAARQRLRLGGRG